MNIRISFLYCIYIDYVFFMRCNEGRTVLHGSIKVLNFETKYKEVHKMQCLSNYCCIGEVLPLAVHFKTK